MLVLQVHQDSVLPVIGNFSIRFHNRDTLGNLPLQPLLESGNTRVHEAVRVPHLVLMEGVKVLGHGILFPLVLDVILMLSQAVDCTEPTLPVVLGHDVGCGALLAGDMVLHPRPGVGGALQT